MIDSKNCTKCGRVIPDGEIAHFIREQTDDGGVKIRLLCALHTDHELTDNWKRPDDG